jgi:hypothetical protein
LNYDVGNEAQVSARQIEIILIDQGVHPAGLTVPGPVGATRVIEVFVPDPTLYPNATHAVHQALTQ